MIRFIDIIDEAEIMAKRVAHKHFNRFEPDELLNESWLMSNKKEFETKGLFLNRLKWDMEHYIREQYGSRKMIKGKKKGKPKIITNCSKVIHSVLDKPLIDKRIKKIEDDELLNFLLKSPSEIEIKIIKKCFLEEKSIDIVRKEMGFSYYTTSKFLKNGLIECKKKLETMDI